MFAMKIGLDVLAKHELTDPKRIAAIGYCFGGTTVLELARSGAALAGVVSFHGGLPRAGRPALVGGDEAVLGRAVPVTPSERIIHQSAYIARLAFRKVAPGGGSFWIASS